MNQIAITIFGPTAVGKTNLAINLAQGNNGEIISVDSMQVYKDFDIGTAKPSKDEMNLVKHHLIDIIDGSVKYSAADFRNTAEKIISDLTSKKKVPYLVGGTGLYFNALFYGMIDIPLIDQRIRELLKYACEQYGQDFLYEMLKQHDPDFAQKIHENDKQRTIRALEIFLQTGNTFSSYLQTENVKSEIKYIKIGLNMPREKLYDRINQRVDIMINEGLIDEVKKLAEMGYSADSPGMKGIGYKEVLEYLDDKCTKDEMIYNIKINSRHYAKRQLTWFRAIEDVKWFDVCENNFIENVKNYISTQTDKINSGANNAF